MIKGFIKPSVAISIVLFLAIAPTGCKIGDAVQKAGIIPAHSAADQSAKKTQISPVKLSWYFPWTQQADQDRVWEEVNKNLQIKINAIIDFKPVDWSSWNDKMSMTLATGDNWDITFSCNWQKGANYQASVAKGAFLALDELLETYAPTVSAYPKKYWDCTKINGKIYGVFNMQIEASQWGLCFDRNTVEKLNLLEAVNRVKKIEDIEPLLDVVKRGDTGMYALGDLSQLDGAKYFQEGYIEILPAQKIYVNKQDPELRAVNIYEEPFLADYHRLKNDWYRKGFIKKDQLTISGWDPVRAAGKVFIYGSTIKPGGDIEVMNRFGHPVILKPVGPAMVNPNGPTSTMESVNVNCRYPEMAVMLFELMNTDKELFNLLAFGLEGIHYVKVNRNTVDIPKNSKYNPSCAWEFGNTFNAYIMKGQPEDVWEQTRKLNESAEQNPLTGFNFNAESVKTEIANIDGVLSKYDQMIINGVGDQTEQLKECIDGMKKAGMDKVLAEVQKQINAFKASDR